MDLPASMDNDEDNSDLNDSDSDFEFTTKFEQDRLSEEDDQARTQFKINQQIQQQQHQFYIQQQQQQLQLNENFNLLAKANGNQSSRKKLTKKKASCGKKAGFKENIKLHSNENLENKINSEDEYESRPAILRNMSGLANTTNTNYSSDLLQNVLINAESIEEASNTFYFMDTFS